MMYGPLDLAEVCKDCYKVVAGRHNVGGSSRLWACYLQACLSLCISILCCLPQETLRLRAHPAPRFL